MKWVLNPWEPPTNYLYLIACTHSPPCCDDVQLHVYVLLFLFDVWNHSRNAGSFGSIAFNMSVRHICQLRVPFMHCHKYRMFNKVLKAWRSSGYNSIHTSWSDTVHVHDEYKIWICKKYLCTMHLLYTVCADASNPDTAVSITIYKSNQNRKAK